MYPAEWKQTTTADNATGTITVQAITGKRHYITHLSASFSAAAIKLLTLKQGSVVKYSFHVHNAMIQNFDQPLVFEQGEAVVAELAASGSGGVIGAINLNGYTD